MPCLAFAFFVCLFVGGLLLLIRVLVLVCGNCCYFPSYCHCAIAFASVFSISLMPGIGMEREIHAERKSFHINKRQDQDKMEKKERFFEDAVTIRDELYVLRIE